MNDPAAPIGPSGPTGLPRIEVVETAPGEQRVRITFLRRVDAASQGFSYAAEFGDSLLASEWSPSPGTPTVTPINADWEEITVEDHLTTSGSAERFARVAVTFAP